MSELLKDSLETATIIDKGDYKYIYHPLSDGIPLLSPKLLDEVAEGLLKIINWQGAEAIITIEAMGIPLATALSLKTGIPLNIVRKRKYGNANEVIISQKTGYGASTLYLNGIKRNDKVIVIDCVVSTGGTLISVLQALKNIQANVQDVACAYSKAGGKEKVFNETGYEVKTLLDVKVDENNKVIII